MLENKAFSKIVESKVDGIIEQFRIQTTRNFTGRLVLSG